MTPLAAFVLLFLAVGAGFIFVHLVAGALIRPRKPGAEKGTIYECGEPTIGSAWIQFDLRFYVVALLFVVFDVEVAFFFPWAEVFGKANALATLDDPGDDRAAWKDYSEKLDDLASPVAVPRTAGERALLVDLRDPDKLEQRREAIKEARKKQAARKDMSEEEAMLLQSGDPDKHFQRTREQARGLAWLALIEVLVFFGVLLVGFAYLWRRGDLAWVRSTAAEKTDPAVLTGTAPAGVKEMAGTGS